MTSTESRTWSPTRWFRFGTRTLFVIVTLACIGLAWHSYEARNRNRVICDQLVDTVLLRCHFEAWENSTEHAVLVKTLATDLTTTQGFQASILRPDGTFSDGTAADAFEKDLLARWGTSSSQAAPTGEDHQGRGSFLSPKYTYYKAVRVSANCTACHVQLGSKPGEVIGVVKIELGN